MTKQIKPNCNEGVPCFAKTHGYAKKCTILKESYPIGCCPFCKPERYVTNGKYYPLDKDYAKKHGGDARA